MHAANALPELQRRFLAALYDDAGAGPVDGIVGNGLDPAARLRIYRHSGAAIHAGALRTTYPAVLALVGEDFFEQTARGYRREFPSRSGNLQAFGDTLADYLASLPASHQYPWLPDVARLEWLRQECVLAADARGAGTTDRDAAARVAPSVRLLASAYPVLTIWGYALHPTAENLQLGDAGENVALWREDGEVAMTALDTASLACLRALVRGSGLRAAAAAGCACDARFDADACLASFARHGLLPASAAPAPPDEESWP